MIIKFTYNKSDKQAEKFVNQINVDWLMSAGNEFKDVPYEMNSVFNEDKEYCKIEVISKGKIIYKRMDFDFNELTKFLKSWQ